MSKFYSHFVILLLLLSYNFSLAEKINWIGTSANTQWDLASNWDLARIPIVSDSVYTGYGDHIDLSTNYTAEVRYMKLLGTLTIPATSELIFTNGKFDALGTLYNYGTIRVNNSPEIGLECNTQAANRPFDNYGNIYIDNASLQGLVVWNNQVLSNKSGGLIHVQNSGMESLSLGSFQSGVLENEGNIILETSASGIGINIMNETAKFDNFLCGKVAVYDAVVMLDGIFENSGFFKQDYIGDNDLGNLALTEVYNKGVIEDWHDSFKPADFDEQSLWVSRVSFIKLKTGQPIAIFQSDSLMGINTSDIYSDELLTINAGSYDKTTNIWIPNANANGLSTFYIKVAQQSNTCLDTLKFDLEFPVEAANYWLGGSGSWQNAAKWSTGAVPNATEVVSIYYTTDQVGIHNSTATAKTIYLFGELTITASGILNISAGSSEIGIDATDATIINNGVMNFLNAQYSMRLRYSSLTNNHQINCLGTGLGIDIYGSFSNQPILDNFGIIQGSGGARLLSGGTWSIVNNHGSLVYYNPTSIAINCNTLTNYGSILVEGDGTNGTGFVGYTYNEPGATMTLKELMIGYSGGVENQGTITVTFSGIGTEAKGNLTNMSGGLIKIKDCNVGASIYSGGLFNLSGGSVLIDGSIQYGLHVKTPALFSSVDVENEGLIFINETTGVGIYCERSIDNKGNGVIKVKDSGSHGIHMPTLGSYLENYDFAQLDIKESNGHGLLVEGGSFVNLNGSVTTIDSAGLSGIYVGDYINVFGTHYGTVQNSGDIEIGSTIAENAIELETGTSITNVECYGEIKCEQKIVLNGLFNNYGLYKHLASGTSTIASNLQNYGVVHDPLGNLPSPSTWNLGHYVGKKSGMYNEGVSISNAVLKHSSITTGFVLDTLWYLDPNLTLLGGTYNRNLNTLTPNGQAIDSTKFYFEAVKGNCFYMNSDTIFVKFTNPINKVCGQIVWEGGTGSFMQPSNWNKYRLPSSCDSVMIVGVLDSINLNNATPITVKHISNLGSLLLSPLVNLTVENSGGNGIINNNQIINKGNLTIQNTSQVGYVGSTSSALTNEGDITISGIGLQGITLSSGSITNKVAATFTIDNTVLEGLKLINNGYFLQRGSLVIDN